MGDSSKAVFLSYASEDGEAAVRIGEALQAAGLEVWLDQSDLRGGDAWDAKIRSQIKACALFLPLISNNTRARHEGYFRLEWKLAVDRSYLMSQARAFLLPVAIDGIDQRHESVPERFREVQWLRLPGGAPSTSFIDRVRHLLAEPVSANDAPTSRIIKPLHGGAPTRSVSWRWIGLAIVVMAAFGFAAYRYLPIIRQAAPQASVNADLAPSLRPSEHSIAVMPFANLSGDPSQEYFSDGLSEELRTSLARLQGLQVASRSSSVSFKGKPGTADEIGQKLHVAALLEGSVRRYDSNVRISVQLVDAKSGFEVWSQSYDRELKDILALQSEIAAAVAQGLRLKLVDNIPDVIGAGGTANPQALDLYLRANRAAVKVSLQGQLEALSLCNEAIRLDSAYAKAYAFRAQREAILAGSYDPIERVASRLAESRRDIERAIELTPRDPLFHSAYAALLTIYLDFAAAQREYEKAGELSPDLVETLGSRAKFEGYLGNRSEVLRLTQRIVQLNSAHAQSYVNGAAGLASVGLYEDALKFVDRADVMGAANSIQVRCIALVWSKRDDEVISRCSQEEDLAPMQAFVAIALSRKNRKQEADALLQKIVKDNGDAAAYQYALIDSQRGDTVGALKWIEKAYELKDGGLIDMKQDPLLDPIRNQPRFQAVLKKLNFPT